MSSFYVFYCGRFIPIYRFRKDLSDSDDNCCPAKKWMHNSTTAICKWNNCFYLPAIDYLNDNLHVCLFYFRVVSPKRTVAIYKIRVNNARVLYVLLFIYDASRLYTRNFFFSKGKCFNMFCLIITKFYENRKQLSIYLTYSKMQ